MNSLKQQSNPTDSVVHNFLEVDFLAPILPTLTLDSFITRTGSNPVNSAETPPFSTTYCQVLNKLSQSILKDQILRKDAGSVSLAYWLRNAQIQQIKQDFDRKTASNQKLITVPAGRVFHIAPSNVDTMFVYSWAISFLCGNANITRISGQRSAITIALLSCIDKLMAQEPILQSNNLFITYPHSLKITELISQWCSHRTIWGGDNTAASIRPIPLNPHASERVFASKFSYSIVKADHFQSQSPEILADIANRFYNDIFWFDQMACSSPHIIFWVGSPDTILTATAKFNSALENIVQSRKYQPSTSSAVKRLNYAFDLATTKESQVSLENSGFIAINLQNFDDLDKDICGGGLVTHVCISHLSEIIKFVTDRDQTITHYGFDLLELRELAYLAGSKGVDRIVPIGDALAFDIHWDGYDLIKDFTREVVVY
jgi:Acyl-CoA reductase (LuxC)